MNAGEGLQPELFPPEDKGDTPAPAKPVCPHCGGSAVIERLGVIACSECGAGREQMAAADRVADLNLKRRRKFRRGAH